MPLTIPPYEGQGWTDNSTPDLSAETLNAVDDGIAAVTNGVNAIAAAVVSQIINDPEKIASIAVAYAQQQQINTINSDLTTVSNNLSKLNKATLISDCDAVSDTGLYYYNSSTSHIPVASTFGFVRHSKIASWNYQEAFPTDGGYYIRRKIDSGAWTAWTAK